MAINHTKKKGLLMIVDKVSYFPTVTLCHTMKIWLVYFQLNKKGRKPSVKSGRKTREGAKHSVTQRDRGEIFWNLFFNTAKVLGE